MTNDGRSDLKNHPVVSHDDWISARTAFLAKEKEFTRLRDQLNQQRRQLPWEAVRKDYVFDGPNGSQSLAELFDGRSQLIVYHFMFHPSDDVGCPHCSLRADNFNGIIPHLNQRDVTMIAVSRAPFGKLATFQKRMRWTSSGSHPAPQISISTTTSLSRQKSLPRKKRSTTSKFKTRKPEPALSLSRPGAPGPGRGHPWPLLGAAPR